MSSTKDQDEFRKYLENTGVFELLSKSMLQLYKEPADPKRALTNCRLAIGESEDDKREIQLLSLENNRLKAMVKEMEAQEADILVRLDRHKANPATVAAPTVTEPGDAAPAAMETQEEVAEEESMETEAPVADDTAAETGTVGTAAFLQRSKLP